MMESDGLLLGPYHPIEAKLRNAIRIYEAVGDDLLGHAGIRGLLEQYGTAVNESWRAMDVHGVVRECTDCATNDGGSCCGKGIEDKFDAVLLLINLLLGISLPVRRTDPEGCWFLGSEGCVIAARQVICVNYMCRRLYKALDEDSLHAVQQAMGRETDLLFMLEERIKAWLKDSCH